MAQLAELVQQIAQLSALEQQELLNQLTTRQISPQGREDEPAEVVGIVKTADVCGGAARVAGTRIPVWTLERMRQLGVSEADILRSYPTLGAASLVQAWMYAESHTDEIAQEIRENEED